MNPKRRSTERAGERLPGRNTPKAAPVDRNVVTELLDEGVRARLAQRKVYTRLERGLARPGQHRRTALAAIILYLVDARIPGNGGNGELNVSELCEKMQRSPYQVSPLLYELWKHRIIDMRKVKKITATGALNYRYYSLSDNALLWWKSLTGKSI